MGGVARLLFEGVADSARGATGTARAIHQLREDDRTRAVSSGAGKYEVALLDALFRQPLVNSNWVQQHLNVTSPTANKALEPGAVPESCAR